MKNKDEQRLLASGVDRISQIFSFAEPQNRGRGIAQYPLVPTPKIEIGGGVYVMRGEHGLFEVHRKQTYLK